MHQCALECLKCFLDMVYVNKHTIKLDFSAFLLREVDISKIIEREIYEII
jgi:hypothetical protein